MTDLKVTASRRRRLVTLLREQWVFAALLGIVWCGDVLFTVDRTDSALVLIPGSTVMAVLALVGWRYPAWAGLAASLVVLGTTGLIELVGAYMYPVGLDFIQPMENAAGVLLLLYVFWKRSLRVAIPVGTALVGSALAAVIVRSISVYQRYEVSADFDRSLGVGFLQVVLVVGTGLYLRARRRVGVETPSVDSPLRSLLRSQWPVMAALSVLLFGDLARALSYLPGSVVLMLGCVIVAGLAVLAPLRPTEAAMLGSLTLILTAAVLRVLDVPGDAVLGGAPVSAVASGMLLIAAVTRHATPRRALISGATLVAAALFGLFVAPSSFVLSSAGDLISPMVGGGVLLVASVGTGMYFRGRDQERAKSVQEAVSLAQQNERLALARELHDVVAHYVTGMVVQAQAAQLVGKQNPQASVEALDRIVTSGTEALTAMRRLVGTMRGTAGGDAAAAEQSTMDLNADLSAIVGRTNRMMAEHGGPRVELRVDLERQPPLEVARSALRVVQEALTNSEKHAMDASRILVYVTTTAEEHLYVRITDDGSATRAQPVGGSGGYGLVGMRERIELLGGRFKAGPGEHVGWCVQAWLPLDEQEEQA